MGILDGIVNWIAEKVMIGLDLITSSVLGALGCNMNIFLRYFPAAETMYSVFVALAIGIVLLNWVWQLFKNFGVGIGIEAEDPVKLSLRSVFFILLIYYADEIVNTALKIGGTPYNWILTSDLPPISFANFNAVLTVILGVCANGAVAIIALTLVLILAWNYVKLLFEAAERYVLLAVLVYTAKVMADIQADIKSLGSETKYQIVNPYEGQLLYDKALIISQYCASKEDYQAISLADFQCKLDEGKEHFFNYNKEIKTEAVTDEDGTETEVTDVITDVIYTVQYVGENYFADTVFALNEEQKATARDYAENLKLFLGDQFAQEVPYATQKQ